MTSDWAAQRREAARVHEAALAAARATEQAKAQALLDGFVAELQARGVPQVRLVASGYSGGKYRTNVTGWYLRANESLAVDAEARYYVLTVPGGLGARLRGAELTPQAPPLIIGRGGRDGEQMDLADLIAVRLQELSGESAD
ncbi:MAG: hypothetical protein LBR33_02190 [Propionibacteriaceae bacterium]|jgi:hypothetical protein|nr:hypothetical protein [Propionibacteriaceae bacterium]